MKNPIYEAMSNNQFANGGNMVQQFLKFKQNFKGDPQQMVQQLLNSGKVSQAQYDNAVKTANQMMKLFK